MALTTAQHNYIKALMAECKNEMDHYGTKVELDTLAIGTPAFEAAISEADLLANYPSWGSKQSMINARVAISNMKNDASNALPDLSVGAAAALNQ